MHTAGGRADARAQADFYLGQSADEQDCHILYLTFGLFIVLVSKEIILGPNPNPSPQLLLPQTKGETATAHRTEIPMCLSKTNSKDK